MNAKAQLSTTKLGSDGERMPCARAHRLRNSGVTLIELLVTMTIMAIIAAAILGTAAAAIESGREKKTQSIIAKIHTLLMERYASYETRRIDVAPSIVQAIDLWVAGATTPPEFQLRSAARGQMLADARLLGLRELMKKEMPDRADDITHVPQVLARPPALAQTYYRRFQQLPTGEKLSSAECLYLVVMNATGDGEARTLFAKQDIGDVDRDGAPEFLDGWGKPIEWMRWPSGVTSALQPRNPDGTRPGETDHDPFDLFRRDSPTVTTDLNFYPKVRANPQDTSLPSFYDVYNRNMRLRMQRAAGANMTHQLAYRLTPLVYSSGPDGSSALLYIEDPSDAPLDPYLAASSGFPDGTQTGAPSPTDLGASKDDITNHLLEY